MFKSSLIIMGIIIVFLSSSFAEVPYTCVHKGLEIEMDGLPKEGKDQRIKELNDKISSVQKTSDFTQRISSYKKAKSIELKKKDAILILETIHKLAFSSLTPSTKVDFSKGTETLCQSLCKNKDGCLPFDCDSSALVYLAILQDSFDLQNFPALLLTCEPGRELSNDDAATHSLIRWKLNSESYINWETTAGRESRPDYSDVYAKKCKEIKLCSNSFYAEFYNNYGTTLKDRSNRIKAYSEAIKLDPTSTLPYYHRGLVKFALKDYAGTIQDQSKAIQFAPDYPPAYANRADARSFLQNYQEAIKDYSKAIDLNPNELSYYANRAVAKAMLGKHKEAIEDYSYVTSLKTGTNAIGREKGVSMAYSNRGISKLNLKDTTGAISDFKMALQLDSNNKDAKEQLKKLNIIP